MNNNDFATLAYFDIFSYPLTALELQSWRYRRLPLGCLPGKIEKKDGFYFLPERGDILSVRQRRYLQADRKITRAIRFTKFFRLLPSVRLVALCNSLGYSNAAEDSDIDFFILTKPGTIWLTRWWLQGFIRLLRLRPYDRDGRKDSLCLTFFLSTDSLDIRNLQIDDNDIYLHYWLTQLMPLYDPDNNYKNFLKANSWVRKYLPDFIPYRTLSARLVAPLRINFLFSWLTWPFWEKALRWLQLRIMPKEIKQLANQDTRVVINDCILKFHVIDNRLKYKNIWLKKITG